MFQSHVGDETQPKMSKRSRTKADVVPAIPLDPRFSLRVGRKKKALKDELSKPWYTINNRDYATWHEELNSWTEHWQLLYDFVVKPRIALWKFTQRYLLAHKVLNRNSTKQQIRVDFTEIPLLVEKDQTDFTNLDPYQLELKHFVKQNDGCIDCGLEIGGTICEGWAGLGCDNADCEYIHKEICQCETEIKSVSWKQRLEKAIFVLNSDADTELKVFAEKARIEALEAILKNESEPDSFIYRNSVKSAAATREAKASARYKEWLSKHAERECVWFLKNPEFVKIRKTIDINVYWNTSSPNISMELKRDILKYWNSAVSEEYAIDIS